MSEAIIIAIITGIPALIAAILGFLNKKEKADADIVDVSDRDMSQIKEIVQQIALSNDQYINRKLNSMQGQIDRLKKSQLRMKSGLMRAMDVFTGILTEEKELKDVTKIRIQGAMNDINDSLMEDSNG